MTSNQLNYWANQEKIRTDQANENIKQGELSETQRNNLLMGNVAKRNADTNRMGTLLSNATSAFKVLSDALKPDAKLAQTLVGLLG